MTFCVANVTSLFSDVTGPDRGVVFGDRNAQVPAHFIALANATVPLVASRDRCIRAQLASYALVKSAEPRLDDGVKPTPAIEPTLRDVLRSETSATHERLHGHDGLAAVAAGTIDRAAYTALLGRLYGFHQPFELAAQTIPERTRWLETDLAVLGVDAAMLAKLPRCIAFPATASPDYLLGARYVVEGSALGGRGLARQLDGLLGIGINAGRRFFSGHGADTGIVWRGYLAQLSAVSTAVASHAAIVSGAVATFAIFEQWLDEWNQPHE